MTVSFLEVRMLAIRKGYTIEWDRQNVDDQNVHVRIIDADGLELTCPNGPKWHLVGAKFFLGSLPNA